MKIKILNTLLILTSLIGFLQWGKDSHLFLFQAEAEIIGKLFTDPTSVLHPFTVLPLAGQIILLITIFQKNPSKVLTLIGLSGLALLLLFMLLVGILSVNFKIIISTLPFVIVAILSIRHLWLNRSSQSVK
ncbi:MAG: hypothetical protein IPP79_17675 [Chitinophagaceae bacterium]|nr:hypothetical protein [Chitinophagaceae bacterium]